VSSIERRPVPGGGGTQVKVRPITIMAGLAVVALVAGGLVAWRHHRTTASAGRPATLPIEVSRSSAGAMTAIAPVPGGAEPGAVTYVAAPGLPTLTGSAPAWHLVSTGTSTATGVATATTMVPYACAVPMTAPAGVGASQDSMPSLPCRPPMPSGPPPAPVPTTAPPTRVRGDDYPLIGTAAAIADLNRGIGDVGVEPMMGAAVPASDAASATVSTTIVSTTETVGPTTPSVGPLPDPGPVVGPDHPVPSPSPTPTDPTSTPTDPTSTTSTTSAVTTVVIDHATLVVTDMVSTDGTTWQIPAYRFTSSTIPGTWTVLAIDASWFSGPPVTTFPAETFPGKSSPGSTGGGTGGQPPSLGSDTPEHTLEPATTASTTGAPGVVNGPPTPAG
jgi:hypothetical protein